MATDTYDLLLSSMEFAQVASDDRAAEILLGLNLLAVNKERLPADFHLPVEILSNHVALILREQPLVNTLLERIAAVPVAERLDELTTHLNQDQQAADLIDQKYHNYLLVFSTLLVALLLYRHQAVAQFHRDQPRQPRPAHRQCQPGTARGKTHAPAQGCAKRTARQRPPGRHGGNRNQCAAQRGQRTQQREHLRRPVARKLRTSKALGLGKAMQLINEHPDDLGTYLREDEKGKLLPGYLNQLVEAIAVEQQGLTDELAQLSKSVDHIKDIVSTQQSYAGVSSVLEPLQVSA